MRAFVALEVPDPSILDKLVSFQGELSAVGADLKLVERENLHFTVKFLGEIQEADASEAADRLRRLDLKGTDVEIVGVGAFPHPSRPRIVWAGVGRDNATELDAIVAPVTDALRGLGESDPRGFSPHLTLARVRSERSARDLSDAIRANVDRTFGRVRLDALRLKSSILTSRGPSYSDVAVFPLH